MVDPYKDASGTWVIIDDALNIVVVFASGDRDDRWGFDSLGPERSILREDTPYKTVIDNRANTLVWVAAGSRRDLDLAGGVATELDAAMAREINVLGYSSDLLATVCRLYRGHDRALLESLVKIYRESLRGKPAGSKEPP